LETKFTGEPKMPTFTALTIYFLYLLSWLVSAGHCCSFHNDGGHANIDYQSITRANAAARSAGTRCSTARTGRRFALKNVRIFDGTSLHPHNSTVIVDGSHIAHVCTARKAWTPWTQHDACHAVAAATSPNTITTYDGQGMTLLPGLIDSHAHPLSTIHLAELTRFGVTTAVNAFCPDPALCASLRNHTGLTAVVTASFMATSPNSTHAKLVGPENAGLLIRDISQAAAFIRSQVAQPWRADFIKVIGSAPGPGLTQAAQAALAKAAHAAGRRIVLHAASYAAYAEGLAAGVDQIHHAPLDVPADDRLVDMVRGKRKKIGRAVAVCPTLTMMRATVLELQRSRTMGNSSLSFAAANETVSRLHAAGVPILAGTDANLQPAVPARVPFGSSMHDELEHLVAAGLSPVEALNAATVVPARSFGLHDRGVIREGMLADLVLVDGDPTVNITASRNIVRVWVRGVEWKS
jgi:imidazolonepropionase-like amidohydrolase